MGRSDGAGLTPGGELLIAVLTGELGRLGASDDAGSNHVGAGSGDKAAAEGILERLIAEQCNAFHKGSPHTLCLRSAGGPAATGVPAAPYLEDSCEAGAMGCFTVLALAAWRGDLAAVEALLRRGADPNAEPADDVARSRLMTPLGAAAERGHLEVVGVLLDWNARPRLESLTVQPEEWAVGRLFKPAVLAAARAHYDVARLIVQQRQHQQQEGQPAALTRDETVRRLSADGGDPGSAGILGRQGRACGALGLWLLKGTAAITLKVLSFGLVSRIGPRAVSWERELLEALLAAFLRGHKDAVKLLYDQAADPTEGRPSAPTSRTATMLRRAQQSCGNLRAPDLHSSPQQPGGSVTGGGGGTDSREAERNGLIHEVDPLVTPAAAAADRTPQQLAANPSLLRLHATPPPSLSHAHAHERPGGCLSEEGRVRLAEAWQACRGNKLGLLPEHEEALTGVLEAMLIKARKIMKHTQQPLSSDMELELWLATRLALYVLQSRSLLELALGAIINAPLPCGLMARLDSLLDWRFWVHLSADFPTLCAKHLSNIPLVDGTAEAKRRGATTDDYHACPSGASAAAAGGAGAGVGAMVVGTPAAAGPATARTTVTGAAGTAAHPGEAHEVRREFKEAKGGQGHGGKDLLVPHERVKMHKWAKQYSVVTPRHFTRYGALPWTTPQRFVASLLLATVHTLRGAELPERDAELVREMVMLAATPLLLAGRAAVWQSASGVIGTFLLAVVGCVGNAVAAALLMLRAPASRLEALKDLLQMQGGDKLEATCMKVPIRGLANSDAGELLHNLLDSKLDPACFGSPVVKALIVYKWRTFARSYVGFLLAEHLLYMALFITYATSFSRAFWGWDHAAAIAPPPPAAPDTDSADEPDGPQCFSRLQLACIIFLSIQTATYVVHEARQMFNSIKGNWLQQPLNLLDVAGLALVAVVLGLHVRDGCHVDAELIRGLCGVTVLVQFLRLLYYAMPVPGLGGFVSMVLEVIKDLAMFFVFLGILFVGFSTSYMVMMPERTVADVFTSQFTLIFGDFSLGPLTEDSPPPSALMQVLRSLYQILVSIIMLNLLISIINESYARVRETEKFRLLRNQATMITEIEAMVPRRLLRIADATCGGEYLYVLEALSHAERLAASGQDAKQGGKGGGKGQLDPVVMDKLHRAVDGLKRVQADAQSQALKLMEEVTSGLKTLQQELGQLKATVQELD
ncbi:hypothetical protein GPECTOR_16g758 [Gonium pectorale]|uniref:Ion transport domain-containing protein n=1 Tax=Gonium pectorale TaxID=33097 RepID=A0A150GL87_GONPE|nr:hypothetical protein GPECTOR_16g758 [Gonium pectorale]|eukprot:KXZ50583.1 hypothetical protein GPECTOR_16g758 [Gonium pectorale]